MDALRWFNLTAAEAFPLFIALILVFGFLRMVGGNNPVQFWHFVSTYNERTHEERGDINSLGMAAGVVVCLFVPLWIVYVRADVNPWILAVCLIYLGGVKMFASWLRALADRRLGNGSTAPLPPTPDVKTTTTTETRTGGAG